MTPLMQAWSVIHPGPLSSSPLVPAERPRPVPHGSDVLVRIQVCGVCRTDLHLAEGDLAPRHRSVVPGHEVVGEVVERGPASKRLALGARVGIAWLRQTCGQCRWCRSGRENLCHRSLYTGWDADGGYAEYAVVPEAYAYRIPEPFDDVHAAPLLCAGIIGYRSLRRANLPPAGRLGLYGFGASAHLIAQVALAQGAEVHVMTRGERAQLLAKELGCTSVFGPYDTPAVALDSAIIFAPAGELVPLALEALDDGGTLALAGIHMSDVTALDYQRHLFRERTLCSVTSNTRRDGEEFLRLAARLGVRAHTTVYAFEEADQALRHAAEGRGGAAVLRVAGDRPGPTPHNTPT